VLVTVASVQDRDAAKPLLWNCARRSCLSSSPGLYQAHLGRWGSGRETGHLGHDRAQTHRADRQTTR
jgi:hypothetical protein